MQTLRYQVLGAMSVGVEICNDISDENLCLRWLEMATVTSPYMRTSMNKVFKDENLKNARKILELRYSLLNYIYSTYYLDGIIQGLPLARPLLMVSP